VRLSAKKQSLAKAGQFFGIVLRNITEGLQKHRLVMAAVF
jgi:hypothetical protein